MYIKKGMWKKSPSHLLAFSTRDNQTIFNVFNEKVFIHRLIITLFHVIRGYLKFEKQKNFF